MVFHNRDEDLIPLFEDFLCKPPNPVQTCRSPSRKQDLFGRGSVYKTTDRFSCRLIGRGRPFRQGMNPAVNIGIILLVIAIHRF